MSAGPGDGSADSSGRVRTVFLGSGPFGIEALRRLARHPRIELVGVVSAPPRPVGRRAVITPTPIHAAAEALGLPVFTPLRLRDPEAVARIRALEPAFAVLADYGQLVPPAILELRHGALNLHPSLLPRHRGASPIAATILAGDRETGVTLMRMDRGLDTGPIVAVARVPLRGTESAPEVEARLAEVAASLLERSLEGWLDGDLPAVPQSATGVTLTSPLRREDGRLDADRPAAELERRVRAYRPWPGTHLDLPGVRLAVRAAHVEPSQPGDPVGRLVAHGDGLALATAGGRLVLDEVQPAGGRPMSGPELRRGRPALVAAD